MLKHTFPSLGLKIAMQSGIGPYVQYAVVLGIFVVGEVGIVPREGIISLSRSLECKTNVFLYPTVIVFKCSWLLSKMYFIYLQSALLLRSKGASSCF